MFLQYSNLDFNASKTALCVVSLLCWLVPASATAQVVDHGSRAQGMAAFVAVADDPSAVSWNPAGLGGAVVVGALVEWGGGSDVPDGDPRMVGPGAMATRPRARQVSLALPPLGLSYGERRLVTASATGTAVLTAESRDLLGDGVAFGAPGAPAGVAALETRHIGVTLAQSLLPGLVAGATVRVVRGEFATGVAAGSTDRWSGLLDEADGLIADDETRFDLDAGLMATAGRFRLGLVAQNLRAPEWRAADGAVGGFETRVRAGAAWGAGWPGLSPVVVAVDADLTAVDTASGERQDVAAGVEGWLWNRRVGLRGGVRASLMGDGRPVAAAGVSVGLTAAIYIDAHVTRGSNGADRTWSVAGRVTY